MSDIASTSPPPRRSFGKLSIGIAGGIFGTTAALVIGFFMLPNTAPTMVTDAWFFVLFWVYAAAAPLGHLVGLALGVGAMFRSGDRRGLGFLGVLLNALAVAVGAGLLYVVAAGLAGYR